MVIDPHDDHVEVAAFLVETRKREEANRRVVTTLTKSPDDDQQDTDAQLRAASSLIANRAQREATERATRRPHPPEASDKAR